MSLTRKQRWLIVLGAAAPLVERSFATLRSLPADLFLASHGSFFDMEGKRAERNAKDPAEPFIDREGYLRYSEGAELKFREKLADQ